MIIPLKNNIIVSEIEKGEQVTKTGIILTDDNMTTRGIRPRWCKVFQVGPKIQDIKPNDWILVEHGEWSRGFKVDNQTYRWVKEEYILLVQDEKPEGIMTQ